jgi:hypothetical protein
MKYLFIFFFLLFTSHSFGQVVMRDTTIQWKHFDYQLDQYYSLESYSTDEVVTSSFEGIVLENKWVKVVLIPEFGARIISYIYKPTGKEQLYQNPIGVPYNIGNGIFYHDWLMVYGGIFPTFPDPEHGKYWNTPWDAQITNQSVDKVTVAMSQLDTLNNPRHPGQYSGITGISCRYIVSLEANKPYFTVVVELENDGTADNYEYWTCITFAPGSESGNTFTPANSEMIVPIEQYKMGWNQGNWMEGLDSVISTNGAYVMEYDKLAHLSNWEEMGIAYAYPTLEDNFYGVINHENEQGLFRLSSDQSKTPGMKFWTWGNEQGLNADPNNFYDDARPYIELWSGVSNEFFQKSHLGANEMVSWTETYLPTVGIADVDYLSEDIAFTSALEGTNLRTTAFYPLNSATYEINISVDKATESLYSAIEEIVASPTKAFSINLDLNSFELDGALAEIEVELLQNGELVHVEFFNYKENIVANGAIQPIDPELFLRNQSIHLVFESSQARQVAVYDASGKMLSNILPFYQSVEIPYSKSGLYILRVVEGNRVWTKKLLIR